MSDVHSSCRRHSRNVQERYNLAIALTQSWQILLPLLLGAKSVDGMHHKRRLDTHGGPIAAVNSSRKK